MSIAALSPLAMPVGLQNQHDPVPRLRQAARFIMKRDPRRRSGVLSTHAWVLELFTAGAIELNIQQAGWQRFDAGQGVLYPPRTRYRELVPADCDRCESMAVFFDLTAIDAQWLTSVIGSDDVVLFADRHQFAFDLIKQILILFGQDQSGRLFATGCLYQLLAMLCCAPVEGSWRLLSGPRPEAMTMADRADAWMRQNLDKSLTVASIARQMHLSPSGFAHAYRRERGSSPLQRLRLIRVEMVKLHLQFNRTSLQQIASQTGFADAAHLSRVFKQLAGVSPRTYRQQSGQRPT